MKYFKFLHLSFIPILLLSKCSVWNYYPDTDDQGLSRFTSRGYNISSNYINGTPFKNMGPYYPLLQKDSSGSTMDTLKFSWTLYPNNSGPHVFLYKSISFLLPVSQSFSKSNLLGYDGMKFLNSVPVSILDSSSENHRGTGTLYFVSVSEEINDRNLKYIKLSGLFDGNIGDSILITKGRFDFEIGENELNF